MLKTLRFGSVLLGLGAFVVAGCAETEVEEEGGEPAAMPAPDATAPAAPVTAQLSAVENSNITGEVTATHDATDATIQIALYGATSGVSYPAHIHSGTCESGGPVAVELAPVSVTESSTSSSTTVASSNLAAGQSYFVQVHDASGKPIACGNLPGH